MLERADPHKDTRVSKFVTRIPVDVAAFLATLPTGARIGKRMFIESSNEVAVEFEVNEWNTGMAIPMAITRAEIHARTGGPVPAIADGGPMPEEPEPKPKRGRK